MLVPSLALSEGPIREEAPSGRRPDGTFAPGNRAAIKHGAFSVAVRQALLPEQAEMLAAIAVRRKEIEDDLGGVETLSAIVRDSVTRYLELAVVADHLGNELMIGGPLTTKGRQRAALTAYLGVVDRLHRLASTLGLERKSKRVAASPTDYLASLAIQSTEPQP